MLYLLNAPILILACYIQAYDIYYLEMPEYADEMYELCNIKWQESYITLWDEPVDIHKREQEAVKDSKK